MTAATDAAAPAAAAPPAPAFDTVDLPSSFELTIDGRLEKYVLRKLEAADYAKGYKDLLNQLSKAGDLDESNFADTVKIVDSSDQLTIVVIENLDTNRVVSSATVSYFMCVGAI